jgi:hypothetical protein
MLKLTTTIKIMVNFDNFDNFGKFCKNVVLQIISKNYLIVNNQNI